MKNKKRVRLLKEDGKCKKLTTKKYRTRNSPSYSAQSCPNMKKKATMEITIYLLKINLKYIRGRKCNS